MKCREFLGIPVLVWTGTDISIKTDRDEIVDCPVVDDSDRRITFPAITLVAGRLFIWLDTTNCIGVMDKDGLHVLCSTVLQHGWKFQKFLESDTCIVLRAKNSHESRDGILTVSFDLDGNLIDEWQEWDLFPDLNGKPRYRISDIGPSADALYSAAASADHTRTPFVFDCRPDKGSFAYIDFRQWRVYWCLNHSSRVSARTWWPGAPSGLLLPQCAQNVWLSHDGISVYVATEGFGKKFTLIKISAAQSRLALLCRHIRPFSGPCYELNDAAHIGKLACKGR